MLAWRFQALRREITNAARQAFAAIRSEHALERFYAFGLRTSGCAHGMMPAANSEQGFRCVLDKYERYRADTEATLAKIGMTYSHYLKYYRWCTSEWAYETPVGFARVWELLDECNCDIHIEDSPASYDQRLGECYAAMILALKDLDREGFFGIGADREEVTVLCSNADSLETTWLTIESVRMINPATVADRFLPQWMAWQDEENLRQIAKFTDAGSYRVMTALISGQQE